MSFASNLSRPEGCLSPKEFAARANIGLSTVHRYLKRGLLTKIQPAGKNGKVWIPERELFASCEAGLETARDEQRAIASSDNNSAIELLPGKRPAWMDGLHTPDTGGSHAQE